MAQVTPFSKNITLNLKGKLTTLDTPKIMGIINVTPDSFYERSRRKSIDGVLKKAQQMIEEGADYLDIGGYSTRPGAAEVSVTEEINRTVPAIEAIHSEFPYIPISVDTFRSVVAEEAINNGASVINDVSGGTLDPTMHDTVARLKVPYILMHMRGTPQNMTELANYDNVTVEVMKELQQQIVTLRQKGIADIIIDPGFGFAKNISQNFEMLRNLLHFSSFELPLLVGISRKSMIYKSLGISPEEALNGTTALHMIALQFGAHILRVHDVKEAKEAAKLYSLTFS